MAFTARQIRSLLVHSFFLNVNAIQLPGDWGALTWGIVRHRSATVSTDIQLYSTSHSISIERLLCLLAYFHAAAAPDFDSDRVVRFVRVVPAADSLPNWEHVDAPLAVQANLFDAFMEVSDAPGFVDFANQYLQIHQIIPSCTQEEVLFSVVPECMIGLLFCDRMVDSESILILNVRRISNYTGYLNTFRFSGFVEGNKLLDVLAIDAVFSAHFRRECVQRDMNKAFASFRSYRELTQKNKIVTGHWGCGAFGGVINVSQLALTSQDKPSKFLQQLIAAQLAGVELDYSTGREAQTLADLQRLIAAAQGIPLNKLFEILHTFNRRSTPLEYYHARIAEIRQ